MERLAIDPMDLVLKPCALWGKQWLVLTAGDYEAKQYNAMTVAWGSIGMMWNKPFAQVVVRPGRHTFGFMEKHETFTLCAFDSSFRKALNILGSTSGRDTDKIADAGLTPMPASMVQAPVFKEAELALELKKIYWNDLNPGNFLDASIDKNYPLKDYHRIFFGEIMAASASHHFLERQR